MASCECLKPLTSARSIMSSLTMARHLALCISRFLFFSSFWQNVVCPDIHTGCASVMVCTYIYIKKPMLLPNNFSDVHTYVAKKKKRKRKKKKKIHTHSRTPSIHISTFLHHLIHLRTQLTCGPLPSLKVMCTWERCKYHVKDDLIKMYK